MCFLASPVPCDASVSSRQDGWSQSAGLRVPGCWLEAGDAGLA